MYTSIYLSIYIIYIIHKNVLLYKDIFYSLDRTADQYAKNPKRLTKICLKRY